MNLTHLIAYASKSRARTRTRRQAMATRLTRCKSLAINKCKGGYFLKLQDKSGNELKLRVPALSNYADEFNRVFPQRALSPQDALRAGSKYKDDSFIDSHMYRDFKNDPQNNDPYKYVPESIMKLFRNKKLRNSELLI